MNLNHHPTIEQLHDLLKQADDAAGDHILWVKRDGEVELLALPKGSGSNGFPHAHPDMQMRFETFLAGNEYVGPEAAADADWVAELFDRLLREWSGVKGNTASAYVAVL